MIFLHSFALPVPVCSMKTALGLDPLTEAATRWNRLCFSSPFAWCAPWNKIGVCDSSGRQTTNTPLN
jgi:hypothetical protein